jgi:hypothetical protein
VFPHESPTMLPPGLCRQVTSLLCCDGGSLIWAAKPSVRESPAPAKCRNQFWPPSPLRRPSTHLERLRIRPCRRSVRVAISSYFLGRCLHRSDSKKAPLIHFHEANIRCLFCDVFEGRCRGAVRGHGTTTSAVSVETWLATSLRLRMDQSLRTNQSASPCWRSTDQTFA